MADTSKCDNFIPGAFYTTINKYPLKMKHPLYGDDVIYNLLDVKDYFDTNIIFKEEDGYVSSPTTPTFIGTVIKYNTSLPNGFTFVLSFYEKDPINGKETRDLLSFWAQDKDGKLVIPRGFPFEDASVRGTVGQRFILVRPNGQTTGDYIWVCPGQAF
ncbi:hypothetical protein [Pseudomonas phage vB_PA32_GUMS]|nr:hypothetical protein [Pseudomonas phage vB_PA32_GUMS]